MRLPRSFTHLHHILWLWLWTGYPISSFIYCSLRKRIRSFRSHCCHLCPEEKQSETMLRLHSPHKNEHGRIQDQWAQLPLICVASRAPRGIVDRERSWPTKGDVRWGSRDWNTGWWQGRVPCPPHRLLTMSRWQKNPAPHRKCEEQHGTHRGNLRPLLSRQNCDYVSRGVHPCESPLQVTPIWHEGNQEWNNPGEEAGSYDTDPTKTRCLNSKIAVPMPEMCQPVLASSHNNIDIFPVDKCKYLSLKFI